MKDNLSHGGRRAGAGRKPAHEAPKEQRSVALSPRAWAFVALLALQLDCSENEVIERLIRLNPAFVPETEERTSPSMITRNTEVEERTGYRVGADGVLINAPCCCFGESHHGHPYCSEPTAELLAAERDGLIYRSLDTGWQWHAA